MGVAPRAGGADRNITVTSVTVGSVVAPRAEGADRNALSRPEWHGGGGRPPRGARIETPTGIAIGRPNRSLPADPNYPRFLDPPAVLEAERDPATVKREWPAVADRGPVRIARKTALDWPQKGPRSITFHLADGLPAKPQWQLSTRAFSITDRQLTATLNQDRCFAVEG